jgi:small subunit ribosomal protein S21
MDRQQPAWKRNDHYNEPQGFISHIEVEVRDGNIDDALKVLKNKMSKEGILTEIKKRRSYEKPSEKKRRKHREAIKKMRKSRGRKARMARQDNNRDNGR